MLWYPGQSEQSLTRINVFSIVLHYYVLHVHMSWINWSKSLMIICHWSDQLDLKRSSSLHFIRISFSSSPIILALPNSPKNFLPSCFLLVLLGKLQILPCFSLVAKLPFYPQLLLPSVLDRSRFAPKLVHRYQVTNTRVCFLNVWFTSLTSVHGNLEHGLAALTESFCPLESELHNHFHRHPNEKCMHSYVVPFYITHIN